MPFRTPVRFEMLRREECFRMPFKLLTGPDRSPMRILLTEDDPALADLLMRACRREGYALIGRAMA